VDILDLDAERLAERLRHVDVEPAEFRCRRIKRAERHIIAGQADAQRAALDDVVETGGLFGMRCGRHQEKCGGEKIEDAIQGGLSDKPRSRTDAGPYRAR
jgi:hypothetical protein